ncbi:LytTR family DNA-binding domain-containing protein [Spirosoma flavus]
MHLKKYLIVDDLEVEARQLEAQLNKLPFLSLTAICYTLEATLECLAIQPVDLLFLDIKLADQSGLFLLKNGIQLPPVIIISSSPQYALESYEIGKAVDYVLKPFTFDRLSLAVNRALGLQASANSFANKDFIFLKTGRKVQRFNFHEIDFIEAYGIYSKIQTGKQSHVVNERLAALDKLLPAQSFYRVHKTYIVNINKISSYSKNGFRFGEHTVPIGVSYRDKIDKILRLFDHGDSGG